MSTKYSIFLFLFCGCLLTNCVDRECNTIASHPLMNVKFYTLDKYNRPEDVDSTVYFKEIYGVGHSDTLLYVSTNDTLGLGLNEISLPLSQLQNTSAFILRYQSGDIDTLKVKYQLRNVIISEVCGFESYYDSLNYTINGTFKNSYKQIDSIFVKTNTINNQNVIHLQVYYFR